MANYPAPPGHRMAYDRDGSVGFTLTGGVVSTMSTADMQNLNNEASDQITYNLNQYVGVIFPQLRDLVGYFLVGGIYTFNGTPAGHVETSVDTTTGSDGTWVNQGTLVYTNGVPVPAYRNAIQSASWPGVKAVRFAFTSGGSSSQQALDTRAFHLYGDIHAGSEGDSLQLWNPTTDARLSGAALDFGDIPRSNVSQKQFRIKNRSTTKTANNVVVGIEALTDATPALGSQHQFSLDGSTWASTVTVTAIAPGAISPIVYMRRSTDPAAALSVWAARITCVPGSWT